MIKSEYDQLGYSAWEFTYRGSAIDVQTSYTVVVRLRTVYARVAFALI